MKTTHENKETTLRLHEGETFTEGALATQVSYHEMADVPVQEVSLFDHVEGQLEQLARMQSRMSFMMREIRYLMKV